MEDKKIMASGIFEYDWMFSTREKPWHGIGSIVENAPSSSEAIKIAKLDWKVKQFPMSANGKKVDGYYANIRQDNGQVLGVVKERYKIVQNAEAFNFVDDIFNDKNFEVEYETAGSLFNGKRIFLLAKLPEVMLVGDKVENYLFFTNSHDGSSSLTAGLTNIRVVCNNTLQLAIKNSPRVWKCKHTTNINTKKEQARKSIILATDYVEKIQNEAEKMARKKINAEKFFKKLFDEVNLSEKSTEQAVERIFTIYNEKDDLQNFKGTSWGMYNAVADFVSNGKPFRETKNFKDVRLANFFDGNKLLELSQNILLAA